MYCTFFGLQWWSPIMPFCRFFRPGHGATISVVHEARNTVTMIPLRRRDDQEARKALKKSNRSVFHEWSPLSLPSSRVDARAMSLPGNSCNFGPDNSSWIPPSPSPHLHRFPLGEGSQKSSPVQLLSTADLRLRVSPGDECQEASCYVHLGHFI